MNPLAILGGIATTFDVLGGIASLFGASDSKSEAKRQRRIQKEEARANIAALEDFLGRYPQYAALAEATYEEQGIQQFRQLMSNYGTANVAAGYTGQVGPGTSMGLVAAEKRGDVERFAGADLSLAGSEGLYGQGLEVLRGNLEAQRKQAEGQLKVWQTVLGIGSENIPFLPFFNPFGGSRG